jgi:gluconolactonase
VAEVQVPPSIQRVSLDGSLVEIVATEVDGRSLRSPNDLAFGADGRLYFTDPGRIDLSNPDQPGRVYALNPDGSGELVAEMGPTFPNGIAADRDGSIVWVETLTRAVTRHLPSGRTEHICTLPEGHRPDGLAIAADGRLYIAVTDGAGIDVVDPDGAVSDFLPVGSVVTNCAFSGSTLYVTDGNQSPMLDPAYVGSLWALELESVAGLAPFRGAVECRGAGRG